MDPVLGSRTTTRRDQREERADEPDGIGFCRYLERLSIEITGINRIIIRMCEIKQDEKRRLV